jgi:predicted O-methyltransferase YrrM
MGAGMSPLFRFLHSLKERAEFSTHALRGGKESLHPAVLKAVRETALCRLSPDEKILFSRIAARRRELADDRRSITFTDFGKGSSDSTRSTEEMRQGTAAELSVSQISLASKSPLWGCLLHKIVKYAGARHCLEMGTSLGISASYISAALPPAASFTTMEGAVPIAAIAQQTLQSLGLEHKASLCIGPFHETLEPLLQKSPPLDFVFVDGHHDEQATQDYFRRLLPHMHKGGIMVFDDIRWSQGMRRAWNAISRQAASLDLASLDLGSAGMVMPG